MLRTFRVCHLFLLLVLFILASAGVQGCSLLQPKEEPEKLSSSEIYELLTADDDAPKTEVAGARVLAQGVYRSAESGAVALRADGCPNARYLLTQRGREITAELGRWIGFEFVLEGGRQGLESVDAPDAASVSLVPLTLVVRHPPYRNPVTGQVIREEISQFSACIERTGFAVWRVTSDWELVSGPWECELQSDGTPLATVTFLVRGEYSPLAAAVAASAPDFQGTAGGFQAAPEDLTVALDPQLPAGAVDPVPSGQEAATEVVDFSANKILAKWVPVPGGGSVRPLAPTQALAAVRSEPVRQAEQPPAPILARPRPGTQPRYQAQAQPAPALAVPVSESFHGQESLQGHPGVVVVVSSNQFEKSARDDALALRAKGYPAYIGQYKDPRTGRLWHTVRLEGFSSVPQARKAKRDYMRREGRQAFVAVRGSVPNPVRPPALVAAPSAGAPQPVALPSETHYEPTAILPPSLYSVQVGACLLPESARAMKRELESKGYAVRIVLLQDAGGKLWHRVLLGVPYATRDGAWEAVRAYKVREGKKAYVIDNAGRIVRN